MPGARWNGPSSRTPTPARPRAPGRWLSLPATTWAATPPGWRWASDSAPAGSKWAVGTELNLVRRLANAHPDKQVTFLDRTVCYCSTMNRIDLPHLVWSLEELVAGRVPNRITVDPVTAHFARAALDQMLALP